MGLFGKKKKTDEKIVQPVQQEYFQPVEELDFGIPVGNVQPIEPEVEKPEIIFSDFELPSIDNSSKITANNEYIVTPTDFNLLLGVNNQNEINQEIDYSNNENSLHEFVSMENNNQYQEDNNLEYDSNRSFRFFENDSTDYKLTKQKEEVKPIVGTTNIFSIGKVEVSTNFKECPACNQKVDENADFCRNCGYSFGRVR